MLISNLKNEVSRNYYIFLSSIFFINAFMRNGFICLVPILLLFLIKELNSRVIISSLISSILLFEVGGGSDSTLFTPGIIRYFCLLIFIIYILKITKGAYLRQIITVTILLISQIISIILTNNPYRSISEGTTMIVYLSIIINIGFRSIKSNLSNNTDLTDLIINLGYIYGIFLIIGYQYLVFTETIEYNYLSNLSSLKGFILIPLSFQLYKRGFIRSIPIIFLSFLVSAFTAGRTQFFLFLIIITISLINLFLKQIKNLWDLKKINLFNFSLFLSVPIFVSITYRKLILSEIAFKTLGVFNTLNNIFIVRGFDLTLALMIVDPFRFYETREWVTSGTKTILFGNGFGSGININDLLYVDISSMGAYSIPEINEGIAFKLHEIWIWYGLSIGLIGIIIITLPIIFFKPFFKITKNESNLLKISLFLCYVIMWYSLSGNILFWGTLAILNHKENKLITNAKK